MIQSIPFTRAFVPALVCVGFAVAAQDHNSSRSNKTSSIAAPDTGTGSVDMKVKEKANRTKSMSADSSHGSEIELPKATNDAGMLETRSSVTGGGAAGMAIDEGGTPKVHKGKKPAMVDKDKDGDPSVTDCDDNDPKRSLKSGASDCGTAAGKTKNELQDKKNR